MPHHTAVVMKRSLARTTHVRLTSKVMLIDMTHASMSACVLFPTKIAFIHVANNSVLLSEPWYMPLSIANTLSVNCRREKKSAILDAKVLPLNSRTQNARVDLLLGQHAYLQISTRNMFKANSGRTVLHRIISHKLLVHSSTYCTKRIPSKLQNNTRFSTITKKKKLYSPIYCWS